MKARIREGWERAKAAGIDVLTEGIRLAQAVGEHVVQQVAERRVQVPPALLSLLERMGVGSPSRSAEDEIEFVCRPAGPDSYTCRRAGEAGTAEDLEPDLGEQVIAEELGRAEEAATESPPPKAGRRAQGRGGARKGPRGGAAAPDGEVGRSAAAPKPRKAKAAAPRKPRKRLAPSVPPTDGGPGPAGAEK
jgi:hypothetical protein